MENGGNHPQGATAVLYMSRKSGGRGLRFVEHEYENIKITAAIKLFQNPDHSFSAVKMFEEKSMKTGRHSIIKDARKNAEELGIQLQLVYPDHKCITKEGKELKETKVKRCLRSARQKDAIATVEEERWQGKLLRLRWDNEDLNQENCFSSHHLWKTAPTH